MRLARPAADVRDVLARVLDEPDLVAQVRALAPAELAQLIEEVGLEDAGEIVALATCARLLDRLTAMTEGEGDLYDVLTAEETLAEDVSGDRNDRRAEAGFVAAADARAFLKLARMMEHTATDAITKAYFRELGATNASRPSRSRLMKHLPSKSKSRALPKKPSPLALEIAELPAVLRATRLDELAYLVNVLLAGDHRHWRPAAAAEMVVEVATHGFSLLGRSPATEIVVVAFRAGVRAGKLDGATCDRG